MKDYLTEGSSGICEWGIGSKHNTGVSKANSASSHIWLKTKLRIDSEILRIQNRWRESRDASMDHFFSLTPTAHVGLPVYQTHVEQMTATSFNEGKCQAAASNSSLTFKYTEIKKTIIYNSIVCPEAYRLSGIDPITYQPK